GGLIAPPPVTLQSFLMMDKWLTAMGSDTASATVEARVAAGRPADSADFCFLSTDATFSTKGTDMAKCDADPLLKPHSSPRQVAGGPLAENILKCALKQLDPADYAPATLTADQITRLKAVFKGGVCDWSKPGVGQQAAISPLDFTGGPGGS